MPVSKLTRRALLGAGLGLGQLALLDRFGLPSARAAPPDAPSRILTIYLGGGYAPQHMWCPLSADEVVQYLPAPTSGLGEKIFFAPEQVIELSTAGDGAFPRIRGVRTWNPDSPGDRGNYQYLPLGYSWVHHELMKRTTVVHGVDQGTAAHKSGAIAAMCGLAGPDYRAPAIQSVIANYLMGTYGDSRPVPCVCLNTGLMPNPLDLPPASGPTVVSSVGDLIPMLSTKPEDNVWWKGLDARQALDDWDFSGNPLGAPILATDLEAHAFQSARALRGISGAATDAHLQALHDGLQGVSRVLAKDIVSILAKTPGFEHIIAGSDREYGGVVPYPGEGPFGYTIGLANGTIGNGSFWSTFDTALRVMKADLASALHLQLPAFHYDTHNGAGAQFQFLHVRGAFEILGHFLSELAQSPAPDKPGRTLLDDTLVLVFSEFARTWPNSGDHWPITSVTFVGGNVAANREIGGFDFSGFSLGPRGKAVDVLEEGVTEAKRPPRAADVTATACRLMGLEPGKDFFIPGGYGEIAGVRADA
jgi:hypothetical protein